MAVKDGEKYLRAAMDSILAQTFTDFEFIVIDDGSRDGTPGILDGYSDLRIVLIRNQVSVGLTKSLNLGLQKARGAYIARMDADDISLPHRFEVQVKYLDTHSSITVLGTAFSFIDEQGFHLEDHHFPEQHELIVWSLPFYNPIAHPTVMMRTAVIKQLGAYTPDLKRSQDYDLWWRVSSFGQLANLDEICVQLRQHQEQATHEHGREQFAYGIEINAKYLSEKIYREINSSVIEKMWSKNIKTVQDAVDVSNLIWEWYHRNTIGIHSSPALSIIVDDTYNRIARVISPFIGNHKVWPLVVKLSLLGIARKCRQGVVVKSL